MEFPAILKTIASKIAGVAPLLASAIGSPVAGAATAVGVSILANIFGVDPEKPEDILKAINTDPATMLKLQEAEYQHKEKVMQMDNQLKLFQYQDYQNARAAMLAEEQFTGKKNWIVAFLVVTAVLFFGLCLLGAFLSQGVTNQLFLFLIGQQSGIYLAVYNFYFSGLDPKKMFESAVKEGSYLHYPTLKK